MSEPGDGRFEGFVERMRHTGDIYYYKDPSGELRELVEPGDVEEAYAAADRLADAVRQYIEYDSSPRLRSLYAANLSAALAAYDSTREYVRSTR